MRERDLQRLLIAELNELVGSWWVPTVGSAYQRRGTPDVVGVFSGRFIGIECKVPPGRPTKLQLRELRRIASAGGLAFIVEGRSGMEMLLDILEEGEAAWTPMLGRVAMLGSETESDA